MPRRVPAACSVFLIGNSSRTGNPCSKAVADCEISLWSKCFSSSCSCDLVFRLEPGIMESEACRIGERSSPSAFQCERARFTSRSCVCPIASSRLRSPRLARISLTSWARNSKKFTTNSGLPVNLWRNTGFCVATPTGQVSKWHTLISTQPETTSGAVAKPNSSAPSKAAITTSRPVFICPST